MGEKINSKIQAFIFDMDGVLTDTVEYHYRTWKRLAAEEGFPFNREINEQLLGLSREDSLALLFKGTILTESRLQELMERKNKYYLELADQISENDLLPGIQTLLDQIKQLGLKMALASSSKNVAVVLKNLGIASYFESISDGYSVNRNKPAPDLFLHAARQLGVSPQNCIVLEDSEAGIQAAHAANMKAIGIGPAERLAEADYRYDNPTGINLDVILKDTKC